MFDEQNQNNGVEDILAATETAAPAVAAPPGPPSALAGGKLQPVQSNLNPAVMPLEQMSGGGRAGFPFKKIMALIIVVAVLGGGAAAGYFWWQGRGSEGPLGPINVVGQPNQEPAATPPTVEDSSQGSNGINQALDQFQQNSINSAINPFAAPPGADNSPAAAPVAAPILDTDQDGLNDADETAAGTNPRLVDSDADGLSDWEEVTVFGTNPLNSDTDSDNYTDGAEVQNGYNPNGPGKLLDFEKAKSEAQ